MAEIITEDDLPADVITAAGDRLALMIAGANAKATRVAPCLASPTDSWSPSTTYAVDDKVVLAEGEVLQVTTAGTSGSVSPTVPAELGGTVTDGTITWTRIAPTPDQLAEARLILVGAISRWSQAGAGSYSQQTAGPFSVSTDTRQRTGYNLWPSEISDLQALCKNADDNSAFSVDTVPDCWGVHAETCSLAFGALYCSCGVDIAGEPIYGG